MSSQAVVTKKRKLLSSSSFPSQSSVSASESKKISNSSVQCMSLSKQCHASVSVNQPGVWARNAPVSKQIIIQPFQVSPCVPTSFETTTLTKLRNAIQHIQQPNAIVRNCEELYRCVQNLCLMSKSAQLYTVLFESCKKHIKNLIKTLDNEIAMMNLKNLVEFLSLVISVWKNHCQQMGILQQIFLYLDRTYVLQNAHIHSVREFGLDLFRTEFLGMTSVRDRVVSSLLDMIKMEREGFSVDINLLNAVFTMLNDLNIYEQVFESKFLKQTKIFYANESKMMMNEMNIAEYIKHCKMRLSQESLRVRNYLCDSTLKALLTVSETQLVKEHTNQILMKGFKNLLATNCIADLALLFSLFTQVDALRAMREKFFIFIKDAGECILSDSFKCISVTAIEDILQLKHRMDAIVNESFNNNSEFQRCLKEAFEAFMKTHENKPAELLAKYIDEKLRPSENVLSEDALESSLCECMILFPYIESIDVFEAFYKSLLCKRLLNGCSVSDIAEKKMIAKLRTECGAMYTKNIEVMLNDIELSMTFEADFQANQSTDEKSRFFDFSTNILTTSSWPISDAQISVKKPSIVQEYQDAFSKHYVKQHNGRKLLWQTNLSHCVLRASFKHKRQELAVSALQALVLLAFNDQNVMNFHTLQNHTSIDEKQLVEVLESLMRAKTRLLKKRPSGTIISTTDDFMVNSEFKSKQLFVQVSQQSQQTEKEHSKTTEHILADRQPQIDAKIVSIMKSRQTLSHAQLMAEVLSSLKFHISVTDVKKRIENLLEREFICRDQDCTNTYVYIA